MEDEIAEIANKSFSLYKLTPLYAFQNKSFSDIELSLADFIAQNLSLKNMRKKSHQKKINYLGELLEVRIDNLHFEDVATYDSRVEPLKITIEIMSYKDNKNVVHSLFLLPSSFLPQEDEADKFSYYPLVLFKATARIKTQLMEWFKRDYVASLAPLFLPPLYMKYMINIWVDSIHNLPDEDSFEYIPNEMLRSPLKLEYQTNDRNLSSIEISLDQSQVKEICSKLVDRQLFVDVFHEHVLKTTKVNLNSILFYQVTNSLAIFRRDGSVKISGHAYKVYAVKLLQTWIDLAAEKVYQ